MEQSKNTYEIQEWAVLMEREGTFNQFFENDKDVRKHIAFGKHNNNAWPNKTNGTEIPCSSGFPRGTVFLLMPGGGLSTWNIRICNVYTFYSVFCHWRVLSTPDLYSLVVFHFIVNRIEDNYSSDLSNFITRD